MTKDQYKEWAATVAESIQKTQETSHRFVEQIKQHDKESASIVSQQLKLNDDLLKTLVNWLQKNG